MITEREIQAAKLSPTKKDFYQIWNELIDTAGKISERWDPSSTNESDPGIVLLKVLTAIADKLNYNIDKNTLEAFMPSATQEESMRKLCEMMGYNIKYYQSAQTDATISYVGEKTDIGSIKIPMFSTLTNTDNDIVYTTLRDVELNINYNSALETVSSKTVPCIEGSLVQCETNENNIVQINLLDDNNRFYMPEYQIAENGIFVYNYNNSTVARGEKWEQVWNLNTVLTGTKAYKFGFDSKVGMPYLQFPDDVSNLIEDGLLIYYVRTNGANGNISAKTLTSILGAEFVIASGNTDANGEEITLANEEFNVTNASAAQNGRNIESIDEAYNNYKKTIGTFDTLVTCRDYMNKIYQLFDTTTNFPYVSNVVVSDIRDDINRSITLCEFSDKGIKYVSEPLTTTTEEGEIFDKINHFDLMLYPFKTVYNLNTKDEYVNSFNYTKENSNIIEDELEEFKTVSHKYNYPENGEITCIKNYLKLNAKITTTYKVNSAEEASILSNIYTSIYKNFNARKVDFGEEIPYDSILETIESADERIKNVSLEEPVLYTAIQVVVDNDKNEIIEYACQLDNSGIYNPSISTREYRELLNRLTLRNILAGKIELFNYNTNIKREYTEQKYIAYEDYAQKKYELEYPVKENNPDDQVHITEIVPECNLALTKITDDEDYTGYYKTDVLGENEILSCRAPNFRSTITYPAYVNYYVTLKNPNIANAIPATFMSLYMLLTTTDMPALYAPDEIFKFYKQGTTPPTNSLAFNSKGQGENEYYVYEAEPDLTKSGYYYAILTKDTLDFWNTYLKTKDSKTKAVNRNGLYSKDKQLMLSTPIGYCVEKSHAKYRQVNQWTDYAEPLKNYYVQELHDTDIQGTHTKDGLGKDAECHYIPANSEYKLLSNESLEINYTKSSTDDSGIDTVINEVYGEGTIIRPNFDLYDSDSKHSQGAQYTKTSGFDFTKKGYVNPDGMFQFGTNEQVEIRELANVNLYDEKKSSIKTALVYWNLNKNSYNKDNPLAFPFDNDGKYVLKENEYFYYTDPNKLELAWYGYGSEIIKKGLGSTDISKKENDIELSNSEIFQKGLNAVPWVTITGLNENNTITVQEYQYVNIGKGNLAKISFKDTEEPAELNGIYTPCDNLIYFEIGSDGKEGPGQPLPTINIGGADTDYYGWKICSKLLIDVTSDKLQTLEHAYDKITLKGYEGKRSAPKTMEPIVLSPGKNSTSADAQVIPLSFKTNYPIQSSSDKISTEVTKYESDMKTPKEHIDDFSISVFKNVDLVTHTLSGESAKVLSLHNFGEDGIWNSIAFRDFKSEDEYIILNLNIPKNNYGLIMFYFNNKDNRSGTNRPYVSCPGHNQSVGIFNINPNNKESVTINWWKDYVTKSAIYKYYLRDGLNIIKFSPEHTAEMPQETMLYLYPNSVSGASQIVFSDLDCVIDDENQGINLTQIDYQSTSDEESISETLLRNIIEVDPNNNFYYNLILDNSTALDLNEAEVEKLTTPRILYDYNNMNNKFVISEISESDMRAGIAIARSSKL